LSEGGSLQVGFGSKAEVRTSCTSGTLIFHEQAFDCDPNKSASGHVETFGGAIDTLRALVAQSAHGVTGIASLILLADIGDQRFRALKLNFEGGDQRIVRIDDNVSRFPLKSEADSKLHLCSPALPLPIFKG
jgi:hypothetical protein